MYAKCKNYINGVQTQDTLRSGYREKIFYFIEPREAKEKLFVISHILFLHLLTFPPYANPVIILIIFKKNIYEPKSQQPGNTGYSYFRFSYSLQWER